ncbi:MAG: GTPase [Candidatus Woesearchaeota archaeon]
MTNYWKIVNEVMKKSDVLIIVLDARYAKDTRNSEVEDKILKSGKPILYVINKCDIASPEDLKKSKHIQPSVYISAKKHLGTTILRKKIMMISSKIKNDIIKVGVLGYPNVGKSSIINALNGKASTKVSNISGYTKGEQNVRISKRLILIDTPGVIPYLEKDDDKHALIGSINIVNVKNPDLLIISIMKKNPGIIEQMYNVKISKNKELTLENIAKKKGVLLKGGAADINKVSRMILQDLQKGKKNK